MTPRILATVGAVALVVLVACGWSAIASTRRQVEQLKVSQAQAGIGEPPDAATAAEVESLARQKYIAQVNTTLGKIAALDRSYYGKPNANEPFNADFNGVYSEFESVPCPKSLSDLSIAMESGLSSESIFYTENQANQSDYTEAQTAWQKVHTLLASAQAK